MAAFEPSGNGALLLVPLRVWAVEFFEDVLSDDHLHVDLNGVEGALISASFVDYSSAGAQAGLNGTRGRQVIDSPRTLLHFLDLLVTIMENVWGWIWGWIELNDGNSFAMFCTTMRRLKHTAHPPQHPNSRHLGIAIQSERAFFFLPIVPSLMSILANLGGSTRSACPRCPCAASCCPSLRCCGVARSAK